MRRRMRSTTVLLLGLLSLAPGCGRSHNSRYPLSGTVTFRDQPLERGSIEFLPSTGAGGPHAGAVIQEGRYDIPKEYGLEPGTYRVLIRSPKPVEEIPEGSMGSPPTEERIPAEYSSFEEGTVKVEVKPDGDNKYDFNIK